MLAGASATPQDTLCVMVRVDPNGAFVLLRETNERRYGAILAHSRPRFDTNYSSPLKFLVARGTA